MSRKEQEQHLVTVLSEMCLEKLKENRDKVHWNQVGFDWLFARLKDEMAELEEAVRLQKPAIDVWKEAADVANFAAFIADNFMSRGLRSDVQRESSRGNE